MSIVHYQNSTIGRTPSGLIWDANLNQLELADNPGVAAQYFDDFLTYDGAGTGGWVETQATAGTVELDDAINGILKMDSGGTTADQGVQIQLAGESFFPTAGQKVLFECYAAIEDATGQLFMGLAQEDTTAFASGENSTANHIGFESNATTAAANPNVLIAVGEKAGTRESVAGAHTVVDGSSTTQFVNYGFVVDGVSSVTFYVNNVALGRTTITTASVPAMALVPTFVCQSEDATDQPIIWIDYVRVAQIA